MGPPRYGGLPLNQMDDPDTAYSVQSGEASRYSAATSFPCALKLLVSNNVAGSIIGRAGQTISELQSQSSARIKLSQTGDYYPGSQDRVCLIQGHLGHVKGAASLLLDRLFMLQQHQHSQHLAWLSNRSEGAPSFDFVVRILVPSSSCGMIIGKSGSNIRQMEEASGVTSVRLSPKDIVDPNYPAATITAATSERVVTLTGSTLESCLTSVCIILDGMTAHPDICRYTNLTTSYSRLMPDPFSAGQPAMRSAHPPNIQHGNEGALWEPSQYGQPQQAGLAKRVSSSPDLSGGFPAHHHPAAPIDTRPPGPVAPHSQRENMPYSPMFGGPSSSYSPVRQPGQRMPQNPYLHPHMENPAASAPVPVPSSVSAPDLLALQLESMQLPPSPSQQQQQGSLLPNQGHQDYPLFPAPPIQAPGMPQGMSQRPAFTSQVFVPDNMIGSILGRGGKTLTDLQNQSGTRIRISQRGEYMPGTRNRVVIIEGQTAQSISHAQFLMGERMILPRTATYQQVPGQQQQHPHPPATMPNPYPGDNQGGAAGAPPLQEGHLFHHPDSQPPQQPQGGGGGGAHHPSAPANSGTDHSGPSS